MALAIGQESRRLVDTLAVAAAVLASIAMIRLVTGSLPVTLAYAGGLVVLDAAAGTVNGG
jgi:two-component system cell cycle sensor histidine kinase/response regulator CckA